MLLTRLSLTMIAIANLTDCKDSTTKESTAEIDAGSNQVVRGEVDRTDIRVNTTVSPSMNETDGNTTNTTLAPFVTFMVDVSSIVDIHGASSGSNVDSVDSDEEDDGNNDDSFSPIGFLVHNDEVPVVDNVSKNTQSQENPRVVANGRKRRLGRRRVIPQTPTHA